MIKQCLTFFLVVSYIIDAPVTRCMVALIYVLVPTKGNEFRKGSETLGVYIKGRYMLNY